MLREDLAVRGITSIQQVTARNIGVRTCGVQEDPTEELMDVVIPKGTAYPCKKFVTKQTSITNQNSLNIRIIEGDFDHAIYCDEISSTKIGGIPAAPAGEQSFTTVFKIDSNGVLSIEAFSNSEIGQPIQLEIKSEGVRSSKAEIQDAVIEERRDVLAQEKLRLQQEEQQKRDTAMFQEIERYKIRIAPGQVSDQGGVRRQIVAEEERK